MRAPALILAFVIAAWPRGARAEDGDLPKVSVARVAGGTVEASLTPRFVPLGAESGSPETAAAFDLTWRSRGLQLGVESAMARGSLGREDVDAWLAAFAGARLTPTLALVGELRARTELVDVVQTDDDFGRPFELRALGGAAWARGRVELAALGGYESPRGLIAPGPLALLTASGRW